jgi:siroheme synthase
MSGLYTEAARVYFVGGEPGAAYLLMLRAVRIIERAEFVLHDALVEASVRAARAANFSRQARAAHSRPGL